MGISDFVEGIKNWTATHVGIGSVSPGKKPAKRFPNLGEDIQEVMHTPEFEQVMNAASPFLVASLGAWPGYWLYRGLDYHSHRAHVPLPVYIKQTFYQAKLLQLFIILAGVLTIVKDQNNIRIFPRTSTQDNDE